MIQLPRLLRRSGTAPETGTSHASLSLETSLQDASRSVHAADGLVNVIAGLGTERDKRFHSTYADPRLLLRPELESMYRGSWLAKRIVNVVADDMTREWRSVRFSASDMDKRALLRAETRHNVRTKFNEALRWARLYGGALIIIGTRDADMSMPLLPESVKAGDLQWLRVVDRWRISPASALNLDLSDPYFGMPDHYLLADSAVQIHSSRVIRFNGERLPYFSWLRNGRWDDSVLQHVLDSISNRDLSTQAVSAMLYEANIDVVKSPIAEILAQKDGESKLTRRFQLAAMFKSFNRMLLLDNEESYEKKGNNFSGLSDVMREFAVDVCGACDIPMTRLFGQSAGGLNSPGDGETRNYYDMIAARQESELRDQLAQFDEIFVRSELGYMPDDWRSDFNPLWQVSDAEQVDIGVKVTGAVLSAYNAGLIDGAQALRELRASGGSSGMWAHLADEAIQQASGKTI